MSRVRRRPGAVAAVALVGLSMRAPTVSSLHLPLKYKPRFVASEATSMLAHERKSHLLSDLEVELDAYGSLMSASVAVEKLQALNPDLWAYFASIEFAGAQTIDVLIDTGSAGMGIPVATPANWSGEFQKLDPATAKVQKVGCNDPRCQGACKRPSTTHTCSPYGGSCVKSSNGSDVCSFAWLYGDGSSAQGVLGYANVGLGGQWFNTTFGAITNATEGFFEMPRGGGIMGLAFGGYSLCPAEFTCFPPAIDDLIQQKFLDDKFAICANGNDAALVVGRGDAKLQATPIKYVSLQSPYMYYLMNVNDVLLAGQSLLPSLNKPPSSSPTVLTHSMMQALVDTGNSAMHMPEAIFDGFKDALQAKLGPTAPNRRRFRRTIFRFLDDDNARNIFNGYAVYIPPDVLMTLPKLEFVMDNGLVVALTADQYTSEFRTPEIPVPLRRLKIARSQRFVFGQTVLNHMYVEVDRAAKTIGFAQSTPGCLAS